MTLVNFTQCLSSLFILSCFVVRIATAAYSLEETLLRDIIGEVLLDNESTGKCDPNAASGTFSFNFNFGEPYFDTLLYEREQNLFLAELSHVDVLPEKSWTIRVGKGGNIYSYRGPIGEVMPPNRKDEMYMNDEVWQTVAVDSDLNNMTYGHPNGKYFIHQSGIYQKDDPYSTTDPYFFSPTLAHHCSLSRRECIFASWGQIAAVPTKFISKAIYVSRYRDCGDGVLEYTSVIHNADNNLASDLADYTISREAPVEYNYLSVPWFGVNPSRYPDVLVKSAEGAASDYISHFPPPLYGSAVRSNMIDTGGYTLFSEGHLDRPSSFALPGFWASSNPYPDFILGATNFDEAVPCEPFVAHSNYYQAYHVRCALVTDVTYSGRCPGCDLIFTNKVTGGTLNVKNVNHFSYPQAGKYYIFFLPEGGVTTDRWLGDGTGYNDTKGKEVAAEVNEILTVGAEFEITWRDLGFGANEGHVLAFVHGSDDEIATFDAGGSVTRFWKGYGKVEYGTSHNFVRSFLVFNEINFIQLLPGTTFGRNQYIITNKGLNTTALDAQDFTTSAIQDYSLAGELYATPIDLYLSADGTKFGAVVNNDIPCEGIAICSGNSTTQQESTLGFSLPHFLITCGDRTYFGPDLYHFSSFDEGGIIRSYSCDETNISLRPTFKLLGFFAEGSCTPFETAVYDESYCLTEGKPVGSTTPSVSSNPSGEPTTSPTPVPTQTHSQPPSGEPTTSPTPVPTQTHSLPPSGEPTLSPIEMPSNWTTITTGFEGYLRSFGAMFDVEAVNDIAILGFDINSVPRSSVDIEVYTKSGTYVGFQESPADWYLICKTTIDTLGKRKPSVIPFEDTIPVHIPSGSRQAFYITLVHPMMKISKGGGSKVGDLLQSNEDLKVFVGNSIYYYFHREKADRGWDGNIHYTHDVPAVNWMDLATPASQEKFNAKQYDRKKKDRPVLYTDGDQPKLPWGREKKLG